MKYINLILILLVMLPSLGYSQGFRLLDIDYVALEYKEHRNYRDSYFPDYETIEGECTKSNECFQYGANLLFDIKAIEFPWKIQNTNIGLFWRNDVRMDATNKQVRQVGWHWELGIPIGDKVELFHRHHSRHVMENVTEPTKFPLRDEYVIRLNLYERKK